MPTARARHIRTIEMTLLIAFVATLAQALPHEDARLTRPGPGGSHVFPGLTPLLNVRDELPPIGECWKIVEGEAPGGFNRWPDLCARKILQAWEAYWVHGDTAKARAFDAYHHGDASRSVADMESYCERYDELPEAPPGIVLPNVGRAKQTCLDAASVLGDANATSAEVQERISAHHEADASWSAGVIDVMRDKFHALLASEPPGT